MMKKTTCILSVLALVGFQAQADVYIEVAPTSVGPDGMTNGGAAMGLTQAMSVWMWSDTPNTLIRGLSLGLDGRSAQGIPGSGGDYAFTGLGVADPDDRFPFVFNSGILVDQNTITDILMAAESFFGSVEIPTSMANPFVLYTDFGGTPWTDGAGVMPTIEIDWGIGNVPQTIHTYGWYQTPTPSGAMTIGLGLLMGTRRRR